MALWAPRYRVSKKCPESRFSGTLLGTLPETFRARRARETPVVATRFLPIPILHPAFGNRVIGKDPLLPPRIRWNIGRRWGWGCEPVRAWYGWAETRKSEKNWLKNGKCPRPERPTNAPFRLWAISIFRPILFPLNDFRGIVTDCPANAEKIPPKSLKNCPF